MYVSGLSESFKNKYKKDLVYGDQTTTTHGCTLYVEDQQTERVTAFKYSKVHGLLKIKIRIEKYNTTCMERNSTSVMTI